MRVGPSFPKCGSVRPTRQSMKKNEKQPGNDGSDERTVTPYATSISHCSILT